MWLATHNHSFQISTQSAAIAASQWYKKHQSAAASKSFNAPYFRMLILHLEVNREKTKSNKIG